MAITLTYNGTTAHLGDRLYWEDEYSWSPVVQTTAPSTTGAMLVDVGVLQAGRPITLVGTDTQAWIPRALCETLQAWAVLPAITLTLTLRGIPRAVIFDHARRGFEARPLWRLADGEQGAPIDVYLPTLRFLTVGGV